jgi:hypothetical protein
MARQKDPIIQRRNQIEREISKLQSPHGKKKPGDFKSHSAYENWLNSRTRKLEELYEETAILDFPEGYNEVPLAIVAEELGIGLSEIQWIVGEGFVELSNVGFSSASSRVKRDELARLIEVGGEELLKRTRMEIPEMFEEALELLAHRNLIGAKAVYERIEKHDSCINPFALAIEIGIQFLENNVNELQKGIEFILQRDFDDLVPSLAAVRSVFAALPTASHLLEAVRERVAAIADGADIEPFRKSFDPYVGSKFPSQMSENQNFSIFVGDVVLDSIRRYKLLKSLQSSRAYFSDEKEKEIERVVHNAVYTALEANRTYEESPMSKLYVDQYVGLKTSRRKPPQLVELLPRCGDLSSRAR